MSAGIVPLKCALKFNPPTLVLFYKEHKNAKTRRRSMPLRKFKCNTKIDVYVAGLMKDDPVNAQFMRAIPSAQLVHLLEKIQSAIQHTKGKDPPPASKEKTLENATFSAPPPIKEKTAKENAPPNKGSQPSATSSSSPITHSSDVSSLRNLPSLGQPVLQGQHTNRFQMNSAVESLFSENILEEIEEEEEEADEEEEKEGANDGLNQNEKEADVYKMIGSPLPPAATTDTGSHVPDDIFSNKLPLGRKLPPLTHLAPLTSVGGAIPTAAVASTKPKPFLPASNGGSGADGGDNGDGNGDDGNDRGGDIEASLKLKMTSPTSNGGSDNEVDADDDSIDNHIKGHADKSDGDDDSAGDMKGLQTVSSSESKVVPSSFKERTESMSRMTSKSVLDSLSTDAPSRSSALTGHLSSVGAPMSHISFLQSLHSSTLADDQKSLSFDMADQVESEGEEGEGSVSDLEENCLSGDDFRNTGIVTGENSTDDLNRVSEEELAKRKSEMDVAFVANRLKPGDEGYVYDKEVNFGDGRMESGWDSDQESYGEF